MNLIPRLISFICLEIRTFKRLQFFRRLTHIKCFFWDYSVMFDFTFKFQFYCCLLDVILMNFIFYSGHIYARSCWSSIRRIFNLLTLAQNFHWFLGSYMRNIWVKWIEFFSRSKDRLENIFWDAMFHNWYLLNVYKIKFWQLKFKCN